MMVGDPNQVDYDTISPENIMLMINEQKQRYAMG
jgi:hypothetical protein